MSTKTVPQNRRSNNGTYTKPTASLVTITPDLARTWLAKNTDNRNFRPRIASAYARDMKAGAWHVTGEAIKFDEDGVLIDGQHRLAAIVEANVAITMFVIKGLTHESQDAMDSGTKRTAGDMLGLKKVQYATHVAAVARMAINYNEGVFVGAHQHYLRQTSHAEIKKFCEANPDLVEMVAVTMRSWKKIPASYTAIAFAAWVLHDIDKRQATKFFDDLAEQNLHGKGDPKVALLRRLQSAKDNNERLSPIAQTSLIFRAWNAVRAGNDLNKLSPKTSGAFTEPK